MAKATHDFEAVTITRENWQTAVLISEAEYNNMVENQDMLSNPSNLAWLQQPWNQAKHGKVVWHELVAPADESAVYGKRLARLYVATEEW